MSGDEPPQFIGNWSTPARVDARPFRLTPYDVLSLTYLGIAVTIGLSLGFGIESSTGCWWAALVAGLGGFVAPLFVVRNRRLNRLLTRFVRLVEPPQTD